MAYGNGANDGTRFPAVPDSLHGAHEMQDFSRSEDISSHVAPLQTTATDHAPYLGLGARLSQIWINRWTVLLLLILVRVLLAIRHLDSDIASAKTQALSACAGVETVGSAMASMPYYMSQGVNELAAVGVTKAVHGLIEMLQLTVTGVEEIVLFVINMMTSTYVCLITSLITGSTESAISAIEVLGDFMNKTIANLTSEMSNDISTFEADFNKFIGDLNSIPAVFGGSSGNIPTLDLNASIAALNNIHIDPTQMDNDLQKINSSLPTFSQVQNLTNTVISLPFEEVKKLINESRSTYKFEGSTFPLAQRQTLTFCSDNDGIQKFFAGITTIADDARKAFTVIIIILAILVCIPMAYLEIRRWRAMQQRASLIGQNAWDKMDVIYIASRPYTAAAGLKLSSKVGGIRRQNAIRWFVAYCTSLPALFLLALGITGLIACLCQVIILRAIEKEVPALSNEVGNFAGKVVDSLNNASVQWSKEANSVILHTQTKVNSDIFGWVNTTTGAINNTLNEFVGEMTNALNETFGGTILYKPVLGIFDCLVGLKVASFEKGLTWVSKNAVVDFPEFSNNTFSLGAAASLGNDSSVTSFLSSPGSASTNDITGAIDHVTSAIASAIRQEALISAALVLFYLLIVLVGLVRCLIVMAGRDKTRGEGGAAYRGGHVARAAVSPRFNGRAEPLSARTNRFPDIGGPLSSGAEKPYDDDDVWGVPAPEYTEKLGHVAGPRSVDENIVRPSQHRVSSYGAFTGDYSKPPPPPLPLGGN